MVTTIFLASILLVFSGIGLSIGLLIKKKPYLKKRCGSAPSKSREECGKKESCSVCKKDQK